MFKIVSSNPAGSTPTGQGGRTTLAATAKPELGATDKWFLLGGDLVRLRGDGSSPDDVARFEREKTPARIAKGGEEVHTGEPSAQALPAETATPSLVSFRRGNEVLFLDPQTSCLFVEGENGTHRCIFSPKTLSAVGPEALSFSSVTIDAPGLSVRGESDGNGGFRWTPGVVGTVLVAATVGIGGSVYWLSRGEGGEGQGGEKEVVPSVTAGGQGEGPPVSPPDAGLAEKSEKPTDPPAIVVPAGEQPAVVPPLTHLSTPSPAVASEGTPAEKAASMAPVPSVSSRGPGSSEPAREGEAGMLDTVAPKATASVPTTVDNSKPDAAAPPSDPAPGTGLVEGLVLPPIPKEVSSPGTPTIAVGEVAPGVTPPETRPPVVRVPSGTVSSTVTPDALPDFFSVESVYSTLTPASSGVVISNVATESISTFWMEPSSGLVASSVQSADVPQVWDGASGEGVLARKGALVSAPAVPASQVPAFFAQDPVETLMVARPEQPNRPASLSEGTVSSLFHSPFSWPFSLEPVTGPSVLGNPTSKSIP